ncbi:hypothetical protein CHARACLAT_017337 [Characodon lateralis]|uniref:Uncharacterized protein n=1 Tax=Characodon lateralis TaxID=208331 RepID=A0ABU7EUE1_9TELE|nr:hypothetical protein [Characodon lateralis]
MIFLRRWLLLCSVSLLDLTESTSEKDPGLSVSLSLLEPHSWKLRTILPSVRSPACPPSPSCWKHLLKRIQVTKRDTDFSTESHCLPNSASADRFTLPGTFNSNSYILPDSLQQLGSATRSPSLLHRPRAATDCATGPRGAGTLRAFIQPLCAQM